MKLLFSILYISLFSSLCFAQTVGLGTDSPNPKAALDIQATGTQGLLIPRLEASDTTFFGLTIYDKGMLFYDTINKNILVWSGIEWRNIKSEKTNTLQITPWQVGGNNSSISPISFGTNSNSSISLKTNNTNALLIGKNGKIGIGDINLDNQLTGDLVIRRKEISVDGINGVFVDLINEENTFNTLSGIRFSNFPATTTNQQSSGAIFFESDGSSQGNGKFVIANKNGSGTVNMSDGKMSVDKFGHVGIGINSTPHRFEVVEPIGNIKLILSNNHITDYSSNLSLTDKGRIALSLEDGTFHQALILGDFGPLDNNKNYFGISQSQNAGINWKSDLVISFSGNVGISNPSPIAKLDVDGNIATTPFLFTAAIPNTNFILNHENKSIVIIDNQNADFTIKEILPAADGTRLQIINMSAYKMNIVDNGTNLNSIALYDGNPIILTKKGSIDLIYSSKYKLWLSTGSNK